MRKQCKKLTCQSRPSQISWCPCYYAKIPLPALGGTTMSCLLSPPPPCQSGGADPRGIGQMWIHQISRTSGKTAFRLGKSNRTPRSSCGCLCTAALFKNVDLGRLHPIRALQITEFEQSLNFLDIYAESKDFDPGTISAPKWHFLAHRFATEQIFQGEADFFSTQTGRIFAA